MRRLSTGPRTRLGLFAIAVVVMLGGYYFGQQYRLSQLPIDLLDREPFALELLPEDAQGVAGEQQWLFLTAGTRNQCRPLLLRMVSVYNRLADTPDWQNLIHILRLGPSGEDDRLWRQMHWASSSEVSAAQSAALFEQASLTESPACAELVALNPEREAIAVLQFASADQMAEGLRALFDMYE